MKCRNGLLLAALGFASAAASPLADFESPPRDARPKFRYWLPDASVPVKTVVRDVQNIADSGAGGLLLVPFYGYGLGPEVTDWSIYGFGQQAYKDILSAAADASAERGIQLDIQLGAQQGSGPPAEPQTEGLARQLVLGETRLTVGNDASAQASFNVTVPPPNFDYAMYPDIGAVMNLPEVWGQNSILAVVVGKLVKEDGGVALLDEASLTDVTPLVIDGALSWTAPSPGIWVVFGIWEGYTNQRSCIGSSKAVDYLQNGSWVVDHYSAEGAKKLADFWDSELLSDEKVASALNKSLHYAYEDGPELQAALWWTSDLPKIFEKLHGYSVNKYLPLLFQKSNTFFQFAAPYNSSYFLSEEPRDSLGEGGKYSQDYRAALDVGYGEYIKYMSAWAADRGFAFQHQPAFNQPNDQSKAVAVTTIPELEVNPGSIAPYRRFVGAAHLAGRNIITAEFGQTALGAFRARVTDIINLATGAFAGGVNGITLHGYAYSGEYPETSWPGYTVLWYLQVGTFFVSSYNASGHNGLTWTEMWNPRQPAWTHLNDTMLWIGRNQQVLREGVAKLDFAFVNYTSSFDVSKVLYPTEAFNAKGYTYDYISPSDLLSPAAVVEDGVLAKEGPSYKALVLFEQQYLTPEESTALLSFSNAGLPIFIVGSVPDKALGATGQEEVAATVEDLLAQPNVYQYPSKPVEFIVEDLIERGIQRRMSVVSSPGSDATELYTLWRSSNSNQSARDYIFVLNNGTKTNFTLQFNVAGQNVVPYLLDAWTGTQERILVYDTNKDGFQIPITLEQFQSRIVAFMPTDAILGPHVLSHSENIADIRATPSGELEAYVIDSGAAELVLSDRNETVAIPQATEPLPTIGELGPWKLTVESHGPASNDSVESAVETIDVGVLQHLVPWTQIPPLARVSGAGTYETTFNFTGGGNTTTDDLALRLNFGPVRNTIRAWINERQLPPLDLTDAVTDVTEYLVSGSNSVRVEVTSSLFNAVKARGPESLKSASLGPRNPELISGPEFDEFGLIGPVTGQVLRRVSVV